ncbi:hypothetical protein TUM17560_29160 [Serratia marcescens]|nr:hypothetical protein TUM17560_29160 [Serratia marcescens]
MANRAQRPQRVARCLRIQQIHLQVAHTRRWFSAPARDTHHGPALTGQFLNQSAPYYAIGADH